VNGWRKLSQNGLAYIGLALKPKVGKCNRYPNNEPRRGRQILNEIAPATLMEGSTDTGSGKFGQQTRRNCRCAPTRSER
jgi:hypothetical protein